MKYQPDFSADSARHNIVELVTRADLDPGVIIDLGCGHAAVAQPLTDLGFVYVGCDIDEEALAAVADQGHEAHTIDLRVGESELTDALESLLAGRTLVGVLTIDALEHVADPSVLLRAIHQLVQAHGDVSLFVSIPNVSHYDVAAKLLIGRWEYLDIGLLDRTHVHFFTAAALASTMTDAGWREVDANDVHATVTEQLFPADAPVLRPGAPARDFLARIRRRADEHAFTFQFIRRLVPGSDTDPTSRDATTDVFATVIVDVTKPGLDRLVGDLANQTERDFEVRILGEPGPADADALTTSIGAPVAQVRDATGSEKSPAAINEARGRYLCFLDSSDRVGADWLRSVRALADRSPGRVVRTGVVVLDMDDDRGNVESLLHSSPAVDHYSFDYLHMGPANIIAAAAYALPRDACLTTGMQLGVGSGAFSIALAELIELSGLSTIDTVCVATPQASLRDAEQDLDQMAQSRDADAVILPSGAVRRLIDIRRRLEATDRAGTELAAKLAHRTDQIDLLEEQLVRLDSELRSLQAWAQRRPERRLRQWLQRLGHRG